MTTLDDAFKRWHDWWDGVCDVAAKTPEGIAFHAANFVLAHTGGGCTAWERQSAKPGWRVIITDSEGLGHTLHATAIDGHGPDYWLVGAADDDGNGTDCSRCNSVADALAAAARIETELTT